MDYKENLYISQLFDVYGKLLTQNQKDVFEDYYFNNFSLSEIAENRNISRQAVDFTLKNSIAILKNYEESLKFNEKIQNAIDNLNEMINETEDINLKNKIKKIVSKFKE